jgi:hypothetical protein
MSFTIRLCVTYSQLRNENQTLKIENESVKQLKVYNVCLCRRDDNTTVSGHVTESYI